MKTIISTGQGRLHLIDSAVSIKKAGADVKVITGWIPPKIISNKILNIIGIFLGRKNLAYGLRKRNPIELDSNNIKKCSFAEFFMNYLFILSKYQIISRETATSWGWKIYCWQSKKYITNDAEIFHVRTGAGQNGSIEKAKKAGLIVIADQSAAHPFEIKNQLDKAYRNMTNPFNPNLGLWKMVLDDCKKADCILVNSDYIKKSFLEHGFDEEKIRVIPLGIRSNFFNLKSNYQTSSRIKLMYSGSISRWKGFHLLIEACRRLIEINFSFKFDIFGTISKDINIPEWFLNHSAITFHGHVPQDDLKSFLKNADIYIFPSYCDGSSQSQKEAMAAGLPVISNEKTGAPIVHGENGWLIPDDSADAIFDAILTLSKDEKLRERLGLNASDTIKSEHNWSKYGENVVSLYAELINKHKRQ